MPKAGYSRRLLAIPNPYHQSILTKSITDSWNEIEAIYKKSSISNSKPVVDKTGIRALRSIKTFGEFKKECLINSYNKLFELKTDVSRFYGTIYTHIIPWILHSKKTAKLNRNNINLIGNILDKNIRASNSGQTLGIPIGPDTSLIIAEIIGCRLDEILMKKFRSEIQAFRYIDDYYIYCNSYADAEKVLKYLQCNFTEYQLDINEEKTKISKSPFPFETDWSIELGSFVFRRTPKSQLTDIQRFVSLAFKYANINPKESVLNFALSVLKNIHLFNENWNLYQSLILKIANTEPATLPTVTKILVSYGLKVKKTKVKNIIKNIIREHSPKGHHFEVAWALWLCKEFDIKIPNNIAELIFNSNDVVSILIALDLKSTGNINVNVSTSPVEVCLTTESLMEEKWLLTYEAITQGWVKNSKIKVINNNTYFSILNKYKVQFYDPTQRITPLNFVNPKNKDLKQNSFNKDVECKSQINEKYFSLMTNGGNFEY